MNAAAVLMQVLRASGVRYLFGNPGTTELPFLDALADSGLEYIVALQEATAVAAASAEARAGAADRPRVPVAADGPHDSGRRGRRRRGPGRPRRGDARW